MPGPVKTQAVVLRSIRYGEADRIVHLYTRIGAGWGRSRRACGARAAASAAASSRSSASTSSSTRAAASCSRSRPPRRSTATRACAPRRRARRAARACDAVSRLFETDEAHPEVYNLLCNELALLDADPRRATRTNQLAFRLKLLLAAGFAPQLAACAACGAQDHLTGFSGAAGGVVCSACEAVELPARRGGARVPRGRPRRAARRDARRARARAAPGRARDLRDGRAPRRRAYGARRRAG